MRKRIISILVCVSVLVSLALPVLAHTATDEEIAYVTSYMQKYESTSVSVCAVRTLKDLSGDDAYLCLRFNNGGYAILYIAARTLSEYTLSGDVPFNWDSKQIIYAGPENYFTPEELAEADFNSQQLQRMHEIEATFQNTAMQTSLARANGEVAVPQGQVELSHAVQVNGFTCTEATMAKYNYSSTPEDCLDDETAKQYDSGICGTASCSALLAFYQDNVSPTTNYIPVAIRPQSQSDSSKLLAHLFNYIDYGHDGTLPWHLSSGLNQYFQVQGISSQCSASSSSLLSITTGAMDKINSNRPVIIGVSELMGATETGNHWMLAYRYTAIADTISMAIDSATFTACRLQKGSPSAITFDGSWATGLVYLNH